jgi:tetratricopeptide (TPR) repeat protein
MSFELASWLRQAKDCRARGRVKRMRGDALHKGGKVEEAKRAYRDAADDFREPLRALPETIRWQVLNQWPSEQMEPPRQALVDELIELYGSLGGVLRRSDDTTDALASYEDGSAIEQRFNLASTYNRLNAIKYKLLTRTAKLEEVELDLQDLAHHIDHQLATDAKLSDSGWAWADLGDCRLLTGDLDGARQAYKNFINKAESRSPATALGVLAEVARTLEGATGPKALRAVGNIERLMSDFSRDAAI